MKNLTGKTVKELVFEGMLFECDLYSVKRDEYEEKIRLTDGYKKIVRILTATKLIGSEKQIKWANDLRNASANSVAFKAISMSVSNCFKGDFDISKYVANEKKNNFSNLNSSFWISQVKF